MDDGAARQRTAFLTEAELAERYRGLVSAGTLRNWRSQGRGPPFVKVGRQVLYPVAGLDSWERERTVLPASS